ncbi:G-type lectin S-receptor-like serine/threonine-protein kinase At4g27290 isoform X2 [Zingiber officinale]|uniref:G-type lectin S-receptor-like serine/threonine-protein kinase At4g27290 isoform X2 n=1 Tax=Zingiber officinale TaxID=94328 RepID=UPI001C4AB5B4|nr:G-type lectin S-receptor-like serine/threonine-protein kinase At4g27290 isoform X2 [Zingiber officinale]
MNSLMKKILSSMAAVLHLLMAIKLLAGIAVITVHGAEDTMYPGEYLYEGQTLISANGRFTLGFFSPGDRRSVYAGVWYTNVTDTAQAVVWVINNDRPVTISPGYLHFTDDGMFGVYDYEQSRLWVTGSPRRRNSTLVRLSDSGNLMLVDLDSNTTLLQSFDYFGDSMVPGMKLGLDRGSSNLRRQLVSWRTSTNPYPGEYSVAIETRGNRPEMFVRHDQSAAGVVFRSGPWTGRGFSGIPAMANSTRFRFEFVSNSEEVSFSFNATDDSILSRAVVDSGGAFRLQEWSDAGGGWNTEWTVPGDYCDHYARCGANAICSSANSQACLCLQGFVPRIRENWNQNRFSDGCVSTSASSSSPPSPNCSSEGFSQWRMVKLPDTENATAVGNRTLDECRDLCSRNCSCMAHAVTAWDGCLMWRGDLIDVRMFSQGGDELFVRLVAAPDNYSEKQSKRSVKIIAIATTLGILLFLTASVFIWWRRKRIKKEEDLESNLPKLTPWWFDCWSRSSSDGAVHQDDASSIGSLPSFALSTIKSATDNFSTCNKLGEGGFGIVYKGELMDGKQIAVKMLSRYSSQGPDQFRNELSLIANLQHRNLVRLLGCCIEGDERILVLEYMENKSLDAFIYDKTRSGLLDWHTRYQIIISIARGLLYLHQDSNLRVIHRDLKPSNILLDKDMNPKISDFGIARIFEGDNIQENTTTRPIGTFGYMAPEYIGKGVFSLKSDVFSFGVIVLEIISGMRNKVFNLTDCRLNLLGHAYLLWKEGRTLELLDESLGSSSPPPEILECVRVGLLCVQENSEDRPTMAEVVLMLTNEDVPVTPPKEPMSIAEDSDEYSCTSLQTQGSVPTDMPPETRSTPTTAAPIARPYQEQTDWKTDDLCVQRPWKSVSEKAKSR